MPPSSPCPLDRSTFLLHFSLLSWTLRQIAFHLSTWSSLFLHAYPYRSRLRRFLRSLRVFLSPIACHQPIHLSRWAYPPHRTFYQLPDVSDFRSLPRSMTHLSIPFFLLGSGFHLSTFLHTACHRSISPCPDLAIFHRRSCLPELCHHLEFRYQAHSGFLNASYHRSCIHSYEWLRLFHLFFHGRTLQHIWFHWVQWVFLLRAAHLPPTFLHRPLL